jgi:hypothetical protein
MPPPTFYMIPPLTRRAFDELWWARNRKPTAREVRAQLELMGQDAPLDSDPTRTVFPTYPVPGENWVHKRIQHWPAPRVSREDVWSLNSGMDDSDPAATAELVKVWLHVNDASHPFPEQFTFELAAWVSRLRFLEKAGGTPTGEVVDPDSILMWAARFSAREKTARSKAESDLRTNVVLAKMTMTPDAFKRAIDTKQLDGEGIDFEHELRTYYPRLGEHNSDTLRFLVSEGLRLGTDSGRGGMEGLLGNKGIEKMLSNQSAALGDTFLQALGDARATGEWWLQTVKEDPSYPGVELMMTHVLLRHLIHYSDAGGQLEDYDPRDVIQHAVIYVEHLYNTNIWNR